jgi:hypothetical protein
VSQGSSVRARIDQASHPARIRARACFRVGHGGSKPKAIQENDAYKRTQVQHAHFNMLLNESTADSQQSPLPIRYTHTYNTDSFYEVPGQGKIRVTTDQKGNVVDVVNKVRVGDLNVRSPRQLFDWRISVSCETPCTLPRTSNWTFAKWLRRYAAR